MPLRRWLSRLSSGAFPPSVWPRAERANSEIEWPWALFPVRSSSPLVSPWQLRRVAAFPALSSSAARPRGPWRWFPNPPASGLPGWLGELSGLRAQALAPVAQRLAGPVPRARAQAPEPPQPALAGRRAQAEPGWWRRARIALPSRPSFGASPREPWRWCPSPLAAGPRAQVSSLSGRWAVASIAPAAWAVRRAAVARSLPVPAVAGRPAPPRVPGRRSPVLR